MPIATSIYHSLTTSLWLYVLSVLLFVPFESVFGVAKQRRSPKQKSFLVDTLFFFLSPLWLGLLIVPIMWMLVALRDFLQISMMVGNVGNLAVGYQLILVLILGDLCGYWYHRVAHSFDYLWTFHQVHHSSEDMDWLAGSRPHPVDEALTIVASNIPAVLLGFSFAPFLGAVLLLKLHTAFLHSNIRITSRLLDGIITLPKFHHTHHSNDRTSNSKNFATLFRYSIEFSVPMRQLRSGPSGMVYVGGESSA